MTPTPHPHDQPIPTGVAIIGVTLGVLAGITLAWATNISGPGVIGATLLALAQTAWILGRAHHRTRTET